MRLGVSSWGFLSDYKLDDSGKEISSPDGVATYGYSILHEAQKRGWQTYWMQQDRDFPAVLQHGLDAFASFSKELRFDAYSRTVQTQGEGLPELDILLVEWRWPIPGRNCDDVVLYSDPLTYTFKRKDLQPDLKRQLQLLEHYKQQKTKVILFDLDHKLTEEDEIRWGPDAIFETSRAPRRLTKGRIQVEPPTVVSSLSELPTLPADSTRKLVYVGSRYERDDVIDEWIGPVSEAFPGEVIFYGNWTEPRNLAECEKRWPHVQFNGRITTQGFRRAYGTACAVPLLAKRSYMDSGFITPRPFEALLFGSLPLSFAPHRGAYLYTNCGMDSADPQELIDNVGRLASYDLRLRDEARRENIDSLWFMDAKYFVDALEGKPDDCIRPGHA